MEHTGDSHKDGKELVIGAALEIEARIRAGETLEEALKASARSLRDYMQDCICDGLMVPATGKRVDSYLAELLLQPFGCMEEAGVEAGHLVRM